MLRRDCAIEQSQLDAQCLMTMLRQALDEVLYRRAQTPRDLNAAHATLAYFAETDMHEVFPIGRPQDHAHLSRLVHDLFDVQRPFADHAQ